MTMNYKALSFSIREDLTHLVSVGGVPSRNNDSRLWLTHLLQSSNLDWGSETFIDDAMEALETALFWRSFVRQILKESLTVAECGRLRFVFLALLAHAAKKKAIILPPSLRFRGLEPEACLTERSPFTNFFPQLYLEMMAESTPAKYEGYKHVFEARLADCGINYKSRTTNVSFITKYLLSYGVSSFAEMTPESFASYLVEAKDLGDNASPPWKQVCGFLEDKGYLSSGWTQEVLCLFKLSNAVPAHKRNTKKQRVIDGVTYRPMDTEQRNFIRCEDVHNLMYVFAPEKRPSTVEITDDFVISKMAMAEYRPENLLTDDIWKRTQLSFCDLSSIERGTRKGRLRALAKFNTYLFGYLPYFFERHPNCLFEYPDSPSKFVSSVFVKADYVLDGLYRDEAKAMGKVVVYPMPLTDFLAALCASSTNEESTVRDDLALIRRYFQDIIAKYSTIDGVKLSANPIPDFQHVGRKASNKTKKELLDMRYWVLLRIFLKEVSKALLVSTAKILLSPPHRKKIGPCAADSLQSFLDKLYTKQGFEHLASAHMVNMSCIQVGSSLDIGGASTAIDQVVFPHWETGWMQTRKISEGHATIKIPAYQRWLILLVQAYAGQRSSNAAYLCADTFDADYRPTNSEDLAGTLVPLRIRTDKVKVGGFDSCIPEDCMLLLQLVKRIRDCISENEFVNPIFYQDNELSAQGSFRPLLQMNAKNSSIHHPMAPYLAMFEDWLRSHGQEFESQLSFASRGASVEDMDNHRRTGRVLSEPHYYIQYSDADELVPFTPIVIKTAVTPHSLRAQLVTFINLTTGDRDAVRLFTGQTDGVIDFYTKPSIEHAQALARVSALNVVGVTDAQLSQDAVQEALGGNYDGDLPFFSGSSEGLKALRESGENELALNYTHICPYNNRCPDTIINSVGRMNCYACSVACVSEHHAVAISAVIRGGFEEIHEIRESIECSSSEAEKQVLRSRMNAEISKVSGWLVKLRFIQANQGQFVIDGIDSLTSYQAVKESEVANRLMARLKEVNGAPSLQSASLKQQAKVVAGRLMVKLSRRELPNFSSNSTTLAKIDPVKYVVQNLSMLADLQQTTPEQLLRDTMSGMETPLLLEDFGLD